VLVAIAIALPIVCKRAVGDAARPIGSVQSSVVAGGSKLFGVEVVLGVDVG
jgi:hypothetical protein